MTQDDLLGSLPSLLHDAELRDLHLNFPRRRARLVLDVCVGDPDGASMGEREARRAAELVLEGLVFAIIDPPDPDSPHGTGSSLRVDLAGLTPMEMGRLPPVPEGTSVIRLFVDHWNSFVTLAAGEVTACWVESAQVWPADPKRQIEC